MVRSYGSYLLATLELLVLVAKREESSSRFFVKKSDKRQELNDKLPHYSTSSCGDLHSTLNKSALYSTRHFGTVQNVAVYYIRVTKEDDGRNRTR